MVRDCPHPSSLALPKSHICYDGKLTFAWWNREEEENTSEAVNLIIQYEVLIFITGDGFVLEVLSSRITALFSVVYGTTSSPCPDFWPGLPAGRPDFTTPEQTPYNNSASAPLWAALYVGAYRPLPSCFPLADINLIVSQLSGRDHSAGPAVGHAV
jgi:hypothetical protein